MSKRRRKSANKNRTPVKTKHRAAGVLSSFLENLGIQDAEARSRRVGRLRLLGEGLSYRTYLASVSLPHGDADEQMALVVKVPRRHAPDDAGDTVEREAHLLDYLNTCDLPFRLPRTLATLPIPAGLAVVQTFLPGVELRFEPTRRHPEPWLTLAEVAAAIHSVDVEPIADLIPGVMTRRDCALQMLDDLGRVQGEEVAAFSDWAYDHLPPNGPACLLHGDLLGQNVLASTEDGEPAAVIDWGLAEIGDPALELAIVTWGYTQPFKVPESFERFLEAYNRAAVTPVARREVHFYELCMLLDEYGNRVHDYGARSGHAEHARRRVHHLLTRVGAL